MDIIHRLRRKFLFLAFIAVVLILAGALGLINTITYMKMRGEVDTLLDVIVQNDGVLPGHQPGTSTQSWLSDPEWYNDTPEFAHQTRYFRPWKSPAGWQKQMPASRCGECSRTNGPAMPMKCPDGMRGASWWWSWTAPGTWVQWRLSAGIPCGSALSV